MGLTVLIGIWVYYSTKNDNSVTTSAGGDNFATTEEPYNTIGSASEPTNSSTDKIAGVDQLVDGLRNRLLAEPGDVDGWVLLSKSYQHLNRPEEALDAYTKASNLGYQGEFPSATNGARSAISNVRINNLNKVRRFVNLNPPELHPVTDSSAATENGIVVQVSLDSRLLGKLPSDASVFIFARSPKGGAPLAVVRKMVEDLPLELVLDDSQAMIPGKEISTVSQVLVGARISLSGNPLRTASDYEQLSGSIKTSQATTVTLVISHQISDSDSN